MDREKVGRRVGAFVILGLAILAAVVVVLGSKQDLFSEQYILYAEFQDVAGLQSGAAIRLSGVDVGQVGEISFPMDKAQKSLRVRLHIREDVHDRIRTDSTAAIATQGVLGDKYVSITLGTQGEPLPAYASLSSLAPTDYAGIVDTAGLTMQHLESIAGKFDEMFSDGNNEDAKKSATSLFVSLNASANDMRAATKDLRAIVAKVNGGEGTVGALINDPSLYNDVRKLLGGAKKSSVLKMAVRHAVSKNDTPEEEAEKAAEHATEKAEKVEKAEKKAGDETP